MVLQQCVLKLNQISATHLHFITDFVNEQKKNLSPPEPPKRKKKNEETEPNFESL